MQTHLSGSWCKSSRQTLGHSMAQSRATLTAINLLRTLYRTPISWLSVTKMRMNIKLIKHQTLKATVSLLYHLMSTVLRLAARNTTLSSVLNTLVTSMPKSNLRKVLIKLATVRHHLGTQAFWTDPLKEPSLPIASSLPLATWKHKIRLGHPFLIVS